MEKIRFDVLHDEEEKIKNLDLGGWLVLQNAEHFRNELLGINGKVANNFNLNISEPVEIDLSGIQILIAFFRNLDNLNIPYKVDWQIDEYKNSFLCNIGFENKLKLTQS